MAAVSVACSEPPNKEFHQAEGALAAARAAEADVYAADELKAAESAIAKYDGAVAQRDYRLALSLALEARDNAYEAAKHAGDEKAAARSQAERAVADLEKLIAAAGSHPAPGRVPTTGAPVASKSAESALQEARTLIGKQDYRGALRVVTPVAEELRALTESAAPAAGRKSR